MNIVFLDVDGVLNSINNLIRVYNETHKSHSAYSYPFDYSCLDNLKELITESDSNIVITSSWRKEQEGTEILLNTLKAYELDKYVIGITPILGLSRGKEIEKYLANLEDSTDISIVILDDDVDMGNLREYLVQTNTMTGLTREDVEQALKILQEQKNKRLKLENN